MRSLLPLIERLPSLYRPEQEDLARLGASTGTPATLLTRFLGAVAAELDTAHEETSMVLPAHWYLHADRAAFDPWFALRRERAALPALVPTDRLDYADARAFLLAVHDANTPLTAYLRQRFGPLQSELDAWNGAQPLSIELQRRGLDALTRIVRGPLLYDADRFQGIALAPATLATAQTNPPGAERTAVNVQLLLEAFPTTLRRTTLDLPWVRDLGRLAASVPLTPWREPPALRETVEAFRLRLARMVALYRNGLGTMQALRSVVEATLPVDAAQPAELRDLPFAIEEFTPLSVTQVAAPTNGAPAELVGPLMRWSISNPGIESAAPTLFITGLSPATGIGAAVQPMIELFEHDSVRPRIAIGCAQTIAPDQTLRLRPAFNTWSLGEEGLTRAAHLPAADAPADPSEPGAAQEVSGAPPDIVAVFAATNGMLWAAADHGIRLARFDGSTWIDVAGALPEIRCFAEHNGALLIGTEAGLLRTPLFPVEGEDITPAVVAGFAAVGVRTIEPATGSGERWIGTDSDALHWDGSSAPEAIALGGGRGMLTRVHAIHFDPGGALHFGCELGVFEYQPARDHWYWYSGSAFTEQQPEWVRFAETPAGTPADALVFLPAVHALRRGPDAALWLATAAGIARYVARANDAGAYTTVLEAFPDLCAGPVTQITEDARGGTLFCTERGLLRYDGRDWWQRRAHVWTHLGRADLLPGPVTRPRGAWRFDRATDRWQRFETGGAGWVVPVTELRTSSEPAVTDVLMTDHVVADLGTLDGSNFTHSSVVAAADLFLRIKPEDDRIAAGGLPYLPRVPVGQSTWRYLSREPAELEAPAMAARPAWSVEGRLFPPPPALDAPYSGRYDVGTPPDGRFDQAVFAYDPAARVTFNFEPRRPCAVLVRLYRRADDAPYDPAVLERVWAGIQLVRPAGIRVLLAVDETIVRGS